MKLFNYFQTLDERLNASDCYYLGPAFANIITGSVVVEQVLEFLA